MDKLTINLKGLTAVVTGGSGGLGSAMATTLAQAGAQVAVLSRNIETSQPVVRQIEAQGRRAVAVACNVLERTDLEAARHEVHDNR